MTCLLNLSLSQQGWKKLKACLSMFLYVGGVIKSVCPCVAFCVPLCQPVRLSACLLLQKHVPKVSCIGWGSGSIGSLRIQLIPSFLFSSFLQFSTVSPQVIPQVLPVYRNQIRMTTANQSVGETSIPAPGCTHRQDISQDLGQWKGVPGVRQAAADLMHPHLDSVGLQGLSITQSLS